VPFNAGARFIINDKSVHITDIDAGTDSTVNLGIIYADGEGTDDVDAFVSASTAGQAGGFLTIDETSGMTLATTGNGWLALENEANVTEAEGTVTFNVGVVYDN
jgi:translation elongation factor EF-4